MYINNTRKQSIKRHYQLLAKKMKHCYRSSSHKDMEF
ncbi:hypothetical protein OIU77_005005, partial [Salix suchowensis]